MILITLVENTSISEELKSEHGLSLYIETKKHKLLFDLGASGLFAENAKKLNVDLAEVDLVVISHGHYDHGGGLNAFLNVNKKAQIYLNQKAFGKYYSNRPGGEKAYIGLDDSLMSNERFIYSGDYLCIDDELELFSNVRGRNLYPSGNQDLFMKRGSEYVQDDFAHEQSLVIKEDGKEVLIAGCAHNGIVNIIEHVRAKKNGRLPTHVIGGFHLYNPSAKRHEEPAKVREIGEYLKNTGLEYYTCHCTGLESYRHLQDLMGEQIGYLATGNQLFL